MPNDDGRRQWQLLVTLRQESSLESLSASHTTVMQVAVVYACFTFLQC
jgi:hypothetical protein